MVLLSFRKGRHAPIFHFCVTAYFSKTQSSDSTPPAIRCSTRMRNKDVGQIYINVKILSVIIKTLFILK